MADIDRDDVFEDEDGDTGDDSGSTNSAPPDKASKPDEASDKRANDLMSKWQAEQSKSAKLQKELDVARAGQATASDSSGSAGKSDIDEYVEFARENARTMLFNSDPRFKEYGMEPDTLSGSTLTEMKASWAAQVKMVDGIESRSRNKVLLEHGLAPEVVGSAADAPESFATMSDEDFAKFLVKRDAAL